jgi:pimeloyl-ACP methyl ester carboxylesterase
MVTQRTITAYGQHMPSVFLPSSPLAGERSVTIAYRQAGHGPALVFLHGGWGYDVYPIDVGAFDGHTVIIPWRSGYGGSSPLDAFPADFHSRAVQETLLVLDALGIERAVWWGHSDGAVIAAMAAIEAPHRVRAVVLEALHFFAAKPRSRGFFQGMATDPGSFSARIQRTLAAEHGDDRWRTVLHQDGQAWLDLARDAATPDADLYRGRLPQVQVPTLVVHGGRDPRSEPGELETILAALPHSRCSFHADAGHCPHSESSREEVTGAVNEFLASLQSSRG